MESIQQTFNGDAKLGNRVTAQISRNGDLLHKLYLKVDFTLPNDAAADGTAGKRLTSSHSMDTGC